MGKYTVLICFWTFQAIATTFSPVTIRDQIRESEGIVQGEVLAVNSERDPKIGVVSRVFIKADRWMQAEVEKGHIELYFPGGEVGGEGRLVHGAPKFRPGEKVVVFAKKNDGKTWVQNLGLGKFSIKKLGRAKVMVNQVFPNVPDVGQMPLRSFLSLAKEIKNQKFEERFKDKYELATEKKMSALPQKRLSRSRSIASVGNTSVQSERMNPFWLVLLLGFLGAFIRVAKGRNGQ